MPSILILTKDPELPSYRYRITPVIAALAGRAHVKVITFASRFYIMRVLLLAKAFKAADIVLVQKLRLLPIESILLRAFANVLVMDIDDAIYVSQTRKGGGQPKPSASKLKKFNALASRCDVVLTGNSELASWAGKAGAKTKTFPTGVDACNYQPVKGMPKETVSAVWVGLPGNLKYLDAIHPALAKIQSDYPHFELIVISSQFPDWSDVRIRKVHWSSESEKTEIANADFGLMPLSDDLFSRGKCAFKLLQYMAAGIASIASPVGANCDVIEDGSDGFLADTPDQWYESMVKLIKSPELKQQMAERSRHKAVQFYDGQKIGEDTADYLLNLLIKGSNRN